MGVDEGQGSDFGGLLTLGVEDEGGLRASIGRQCRGGAAVKATDRCSKID